MAKSIQLRFAICVCWFFAAVATSMVVYASEATQAHKGLSAIPFDDFWRILVVIFFGGLMATLMKVTKEDGPRISNLTLEISRDSVGSFVAGLIGFLVMSWIDQEMFRVPILFQPIIIFFCAFRGIKLILLIEPIANEGFAGVINIFREAISRLFGRKNTTPPPTDHNP